MENRKTDQAASDAGTCPKWRREDSDRREISLAGNAAASEAHSRYGETQRAAKARWHVNISTTKSLKIICLLNTDGTIIYIYLRNFLCEYYCDFKRREVLCVT